MPAPEPVRVGFVSLGCPKNLVDTEIMLGRLRDSGFALSGDVGDCDVIVVNTCGFIDPARRESVNTILEMAEHKKKGRCRRLVVAGCMVQRYPRELREEIPEIDAFVGLDGLETIVQAVRLDMRFRGGGSRRSRLRNGPRPVRPSGRPRSGHPSPHRLPEDLRGVRSSVLLLRHPLHPGPDALPHDGFAPARGGGPGAARREGADPHRPGQHRLREGPRGRHRSGGPAPDPGARPGHRVDPDPLRLPRPGHPRAPRDHGRIVQGLPLPRHSAPAFGRGHPEGHETRGQRRRFSTG